MRLPFYFATAVLTSNLFFTYATLWTYSVQVDLVEVSTELEDGVVKKKQVKEWA